MYLSSHLKVIILTLTCKTVLQGSDKLIKLHFLHGRDDIRSHDSLPAVVGGHCVGLGGGVQYEHTGSLQQTGF